MTVRKAVDALEWWIEEKAALFCTFYGSMHMRAFNADSIREFLLQLETPNDVKLTRAAIDLIAQNYWNARCVEDCLRCNLRPRIQEVADGRKVIHVPFGNVEDSSTLLYASPFKGENLNPHNLFEFLFHSRAGTLPWTPDNCAICFIDDNTSTGRQAPAILAQWFGHDTPEEEHHVLPLPTALSVGLSSGSARSANLREYFREFTIIFSTIYASPEGTGEVEKRAKSLGLRVLVTKPAVEWEKTTWSRAVPKEREGDLRRLFEKYGAPLLEDKVGWNATKRQETALGYGGLGRMFLFWYQTPTSMPVMFWRYGIVNGKWWRPLFWRESDYERFIRQFGLWPHKHNENPELTWRYYRTFTSVRERVETELGNPLTFDRVSRAFEQASAEVRKLLRQYADPSKIGQLLEKHLRRQALK